MSFLSVIRFHLHLPFHLYILFRGFRSKENRFYNTKLDERRVDAYGHDPALTFTALHTTFSGLWTVYCLVTLYSIEGPIAAIDGVFFIVALMVGATVFSRWSVYFLNHVFAIQKVIEVSQEQYEGLSALRDATPDLMTLFDLQDRVSLGEFYALTEQLNDESLSLLRKAIGEARLTPPIYT